MDEQVLEKVNFSKELSTRFGSQVPYKKMCIQGCFKTFILVHWRGVIGGGAGLNFRPSTQGACNIFSKISAPSPDLNYGTSLLKGHNLSRLYYRTIMPV